MAKLKMTPIPKDSDHMTLKHFIDCVECGGFIDYDGFGYYATKTEMTDKIIRPSDVTGRASTFDFKTGTMKKIKKKINVDKSFKYIVWFNR